MDSALTWFIRIWVALVLAANAFGVFAIFATNGFWEGISQIQADFSPYNVANIILQLVLLSPALLAFWWRDRCRARRSTFRSGTVSRDQ